MSGNAGAGQEARGEDAEEGAKGEDEAARVAREEDRSLMARVQRGDEAAFGALLDP